MRLLKAKKSQMTIYIVFIILSFILITIAAVLSPLGVLFTTEMYAAGEDMFENELDLSEINNATIRASLQGLVDEATDATETNVEILTDFYQYGWVVVLVIVAIVIFLYARSIVEFNTSRGGLV